MGHAERINAAHAPIVRVLDPAQYWRLRAVIGDVDRARAAVGEAQQRLMQIVQAQVPLLQAVAGDGVDITVLTALDWNDDTCEITLKR